MVSPFADYRPGLRLAFSGLCVVAGLVVGGLNFLLVRRFLLRPVDQVSRQLESLASGEGISATRLSLDSDDALGRLVLQFNALIDRLQGTLRRVIETVEAFVAHADESGKTAHELVANVDRKSQVVDGTATPLFRAAAGVAEDRGGSRPADGVGRRESHRGRRAGAADRRGQ